MPLDPALRLGERSGDEPESVDPALAAAGDEARSLQHSEVLRHGGQRHRERAGEVADGALRAGEPREDGPPRGVREGSERRVQRRTINHMVNYYPRAGRVSRGVSGPAAAGPGRPPTLDILGPMRGHGSTELSLS